MSIVPKVTWVAQELFLSEKVWRGRTSGWGAGESDSPSVESWEDISGDFLHKRTKTLTIVYDNKVLRLLNFCLVWFPAKILRIFFKICTNKHCHSHVNYLYCVRLSSHRSKDCLEGVSSVSICLCSSRAGCRVRRSVCESWRPRCPSCSSGSFMVFAVNCCGATSTSPSCRVWPVCTAAGGDTTRGAALRPEAAAATRSVKNQYWGARTAPLLHAVNSHTNKSTT